MPPETQNVEPEYQVPPEHDPQLSPPLSWHLLKFWRVARIPLVVVILVLAWIFVPQMEARNQQNALADEFFTQCDKTLKDTDQLPKVPEEALADAVKKVDVTADALHSWNPIVSCEIRQKQWVGKIVFAWPYSYTVERTIGPAVGDAGYDAPVSSQ